MDEVRRAKLLADLLKEAMEDIYQSPSAAPRAKSAAPCGCDNNCGDISKHDENTVLVGVVLDSEGETFEDSRLQDRFQFDAGLSNL